MKVADMEIMISKQLHALPKRHYQTAMWILCNQLRWQYGNMLSGTDHALMSETLNLLRESAIEETNSTLARSLHDRWEKFISEVRRVHPGLQNTRVTYAFITAEMAELAPGYQATEWLTNAATDLWRDLTRRQLIDPHEIVGDETPIACTLNFFENVINIIRQTEQSFIDPVSLKVPIPNYSGSRSEY